MCRQKTGWCSKKPGHLQFSNLKVPVLPGVSPGKKNTEIYRFDAILPERYFNVRDDTLLTNA